MTTRGNLDVRDATNPAERPMVSKCTMQEDASSMIIPSGCFHGTVAKRLHTVATLKERQRQESAVVCDGRTLKNTFHFKYLGSMFAADGTDEVDLRRRIGMAMSRCGQLRFILNANNIKMATKMKIYRCAVGSLFTYGNEAWSLSEQNLRKLNGANASCFCTDSPAKPE